MCSPGWSGGEPVASGAELTWPPHPDPLPRRGRGGRTEPPPHRSSGIGLRLRPGAKTPGVTPSPRSRGEGGGEGLDRGGRKRRPTRSLRPAQELSRRSRPRPMSNSRSRSEVELELEVDVELEVEVDLEVAPIDVEVEVDGWRWRRCPTAPAFRRRPDDELTGDESPRSTGCRERSANPVAPAARRSRMATGSIRARGGVSTGCRQRPRAGEGRPAAPGPRRSTSPGGRPGSRRSGPAAWCRGWPPRGPRAPTPRRGPAGPP